MHSKLTNLLLGLILLGAASCSVQKQNSCPSQLCAQKATIIDSICSDLGNSGAPIYLKNDESVCLCECPTKSVLAIKTGSEWKHPIYEIPSDSSIFQQTLLYVIYVEVEDDLTLIVTPEHLFLTASGILKRADRLTPDDRLLDQDRRSLKITALTSGSYEGDFAAIRMPQWNAEDKDIENHLVSTYGVLSGDDFATAFLQPESLREQPQLGTPEYYKAIGSDKDLGLIDLGDTISTNLTFEFVPDKEIPLMEDASYMIPPDYDQLKEGESVALDDRQRQRMALDIKKKFEMNYPDIKFILSWRSARANGSARINRQRRKIVTIFGALVRSRVMYEDGISLAFAHEVGHHYGGPPRSEEAGKRWSSCEGQADYWGATKGMRKIFPGPSVVQKIEAGGNQLYKLYTESLNKNLEEVYKEAFEQLSNRNCSHPKPSCRLQTYLAGMRLAPKPLCTTQ